jgi:hypothetical protein
VNGPGAGVASGSAVGAGDAGAADEPVVVDGVLDVPAVAGAGEVVCPVATVDPPSADAGPVALGPEPHAATTTTASVTTAAKRRLEWRLCIGVFRIEDALLDRLGQAV